MVKNREFMQSRMGMLLIS